MKSLDEEFALAGRGKSLDLERMAEAMTTWGIGIYDHDHVNGTLYGSPRFRELYGMGPDDPLSVEVLGAALFPADMAPALHAVQAAHDPSGDGHFDLLHRIVRKTDRAVRWVHSRSKTTFGIVAGRRVALRTLGSITDMTEHRELELAVERQRKRLDHATAMTSVGIFEMDHRPSYESEGVYLSETFVRVTGISHGLKHDFDAYLRHVHPDDVESVRRALLQVVSSEGPHHLESEHRFIGRDGQVRWFLMRASSTFGGAGPKPLLLSTVGAVLDITPTLRARQDLAERSAILDATPDFVGIADPEGQILYLNQAARDLYGIGASDSLDGHTMSEVHPPEMLEFIQSCALPQAKEHGSWSGETTFRDRQGRVIPMSQVIVSHFDQRPRGERYSTIARNLSREKELEEQFRHAQKMEAVGQLAGGMAHDFNNLLSVVFGFSDLGSDLLAADHPAQDCISEIRIAAERASSLIGQLLAFSRKQIRQPRVIDVNEVVARACPMFRRFISEDIEFTVLHSEVPLRVKADPNQIEQVLLNLVVNARDAMPDGGKLVIETMSRRVDDERLLLGADLSAGSYVVVAVSDNGVGMDAATKQRVFEPFFTTKGHGRGTGLGLSTVFGIVRQSGGGVYVYSEPGRGTTFKVYLPCTDEVEVIEPEAVREVTNIGEATILLAEDDSQVRKMIVTVLSKIGLRVLEASGPVEALSLSRDFDGEVDLLLTDVVMPQMTGTALAHELLKQRPTLRVLYMSGYTENGIVHHGVLDEGVLFLPKPINVQRLLEAIKTAIGR